MVISPRFERGTHSLEGCCSIQLSYETIQLFCKRFAGAYQVFFGKNNVFKDFYILCLYTEKNVFSVGTSMKKSFVFFVLLECVSLTPVRADSFTNDTSGIRSEYKNSEEYMANGAALTAIGANLAYGVNYSGFSGAGVTVAIVDSGTYSVHQDLDGQIVPAAVSQNRYNGEHGTHVSGIVAAKKNNVGMHGVAYNANLLPFSVLLGGSGGCMDRQYCIDPDEAFNRLADDAFDDVLIINNSWGTVYASEASLQVSTGIAKKLTDKGKLIIAAAGNETQLTPNAFPAKMAAYNAETALNLISVVAYNPSELPNSPNFIANYTNLAEGAEKWSLAAPGTFYSTIVYTDGAPQSQRYGDKSGTSMATPAVSGAAALVSEAFPYFDGKQIADVLFSTAFKKEDLTVSPFMLQSGRALYFTDIADDAKAQLDAFLAATGMSCGSGIECNAVTFEKVFGQGLLNVGDAVKGLKYFDAARLTANDYDATLGQFFYTVDTKGYDGVWSNSIGEKSGVGAEGVELHIGLRKKGNGSLTLSGANDFLGISSVEKGSLILTGSLSGGVTVSGGVFTLNGGTVNGALTVEKAGVSQITSGTLNGNVANNGTINAVGGSVDGDVANSGTFNITDTFSVSGSFNNANILNLQNISAFDVPLNNEGTVSVAGNNIISGPIVNGSSGQITVNQGSTMQPLSAITNDGMLTGYGVIDGTVNNNATGGVATSLSSIGTLNSSGIILLSKDSGGSTMASVHVDTLNVTGGRVGLSNDHIVYDNGRTYTIIEAGSISAFSGFEEHTYLSDFITATTSRDGNEIKTKIDYLRISESARTSSFSDDEKKVLSIVDRMFIDEKDANFGAYYNYSSDTLQNQVNSLRSKAKPVQRESLPLTKVMTSQINTHLFTKVMTRDASSTRSPFVPMQQYRGKYYRGRSGGNIRNNNKIWGQILGGRVKDNGDKKLQDEKSNTTSVGVMFGYDHEFSEHFMFGLTAGGARAKMTQDKNKIDVDDYRAGFYTGSRFGNFTVNTTAMGGLQKYRTERYLFLVGDYRKSKGSFDGYSAEFDLTLGYDFMRVPYRDYSFYLRSYLGANVSYIHQDEYKEKEESFLALGVDEINNTSTSISPGLTLGYTFSQAVITADIGYQRILSGDALKSSAYFLTDQTKTRFFSLPAKTDKNFFNVGFGFKTDLTRRLHLDLWGGARRSKNTEALNFSASLSYSF